MTMIVLPQGSLSPTPMVATPRVVAEPARKLRSEAFGRNRPVEWHHPISQELFRDALVRERKRADRYEEAFVLVLVSLNSRAAPQLPWEDLVEALSHTELYADVIGWFEQGSVLGLIRSLADRDPKETATTLARTVQHELVRCLTPDNVDRCSIRLERYSPRGDSMPPVLFDAGHQRRKPQQVARGAAKRMLDIAGST